MQYELKHGDCLDVLRSMPEASVDSVVTDPPYGLAFMGKKWDYDVPSEEIWRECLRVLKPGGHLLAFAGTRTQHRMAVRIEDAGFEIRDMIAWVYGSGFPKSLDVSKAIDKRGGNAHLTAEIGAALKSARKARGVGITEADRTYCDGVTLWSWYEGRPAGQQMPTAEVMRKIAKDWTELSHYADAIEEAEREIVGQKKTCDPVAWYAEAKRGDGIVKITAPATDAARHWQGWGTALKPALEPITVARKPLVGTVAANVLTHGTGAINVDGCRVEALDGYLENAVTQGINTAQTSYEPRRERRTFEPSQSGRWPANLIHDGSDEVMELFPNTTSGSRKAGHHVVAGGQGRYGKFAKGDLPELIGDSGSASRFFYCAKASKSDRGDDNNHPTVKPTALMRYLCRLVTPPAGVVLDPFMGSGSTGKAAMLEGFRFIGIERDASYLEIAKARIASTVGAAASPSNNQQQLW